LLTELTRPPYRVPICRRSLSVESLIDQKRPYMAKMNSGSEIAVS
jgi:hypothetical protein